MQWDDTKNAGFSEVEPWLPLAEPFPGANVAEQRGDRKSIYQLYQRLIFLRKSRDALRIGSYNPIVSRDDLLLFGRRSENDELMIALNLGDRPEAAEFQGHPLDGRLLLSSHLDRDGEKVRGTIDLRPNEGVMIEIER